MPNLALDIQQRLRARLSGLLVFGLGIALAQPHGSAQAGTPFAAVRPYERQATAPSNPQLVSPSIEARVDALLKQMTLDEKIGQLVQYGDSGQAGDTEISRDGQAPGKNPAAHIKIDAMELAATGRLGSMLNVVGADRTNTFQRAAVEKSRLHIPLLFGADILHGYKTVYPIPLGLAATFDPDVVESVSRISAE